MKISPLSFQRDLLLFLYLIYYAQGSLYPSGSIISQLALFLIFGISTSFLVKTLKLKARKGQFYYVWTALFFLNVLGFILTANYGNSYHFSMFKNVLASSLGFFPFYYLAINGVVKPKHFKWFLIFLLPITVMQFLVNKANFISQYETENVVNNISYSFVLLIPFLFFIRNKFFALGILPIIIFFIIQGAKRGALFAGALGVVIYIYFLLKNIKFQSKRKRIKMYLFVAVGLGVISYFAYHQFLENEFLQNRLIAMAGGNTSNRDENFTWIFNAWYSSDSFFHLIFGFGFASSLEITGRNFAHNDWLELLSNFGLLGVIIYSLLFLAAIRFIKSKIVTYDRRLLMLSILSIWFFMTLVSMWYTSISTFTQAILLGYLFGEHEWHKRTLV